MMFPHRVARSGYRQGKGRELVRYFLDCRDNGTNPEPREVVFILILWARKGPCLRADLWERPQAGRPNSIANCVTPNKALNAKAQSFFGLV